MEILTGRFFVQERGKASHDIEVRYQNALSGVRKAAGGPEEDEEFRKLVEEIVGAYELTEWNQLVPIYANALATVGSEAVSRASQQPRIRTALTGSFGRVNAAAVEYAEDRAAEMVGMRWLGGELVPNPNAQWRITDSTRQWLNEAVADAFELGLSPAKLAQKIEASTAFSQSRARMIAHTEVGNTNIASLMQTSIAAGATHKRTTLSADHPDDDDDICVDAAEAGEVPINYDYGGGRKAPLFHPRCKCSISTYVRKL